QKLKKRDKEKKLRQLTKNEKKQKKFLIECNN
ncbi:unnamed protein product, partial [marine sediment metagenome]